MEMVHRRAGLIARVAFGAVLGAAMIMAPLRHGAAQSLPSRLSDAEFWKMVTAFSEKDGVFPSENFLSNETGFQTVIPELQQSMRRGGVYLGVGPEQNFTYIAALQPRIAFVVDIRRQAMLQHLLYKALFELADNRADFLSLLFSRPRPHGLDGKSAPEALFSALDSVAPDSAMFERTLGVIQTRLYYDHGFALSTEDLAAIRHIFDVIYFAGPHLSYSSGSGFMAGAGFPLRGASSSAAINTISMAWMPSLIHPVMGSRPDSVDKQSPARPVMSGLPPQDTLVRPALLSFAGSMSFGITYATLMALTDGVGTQRSYLANESNYHEVRELELRNLLIPIVGDFAGPKALRAVGDFVRDHGAVVTTIYTSNVEQYLFQGGSWRDYYGNVATLPLDETSTFIRSGGSPNGSGGVLWAHSGGMGATSLGSVLDLLRGVADGRVQGYANVFQFPRH